MPAVRHYLVHGVPMVTTEVVTAWPAAPIGHGGAWNLEVAVNSTELAADLPAEAGPARWWWHDDADRSVLQAVGTPIGRDSGAGSMRITVDHRGRTIQVLHSRDDRAGSIELLTRWVLPDIARAELDALPLHACVVAVDGQAVVIAGDSGRGKSSLAAALILTGAELISDEPACVVIEDGSAALWPGGHMLRVLPETWDSLELERAGLTASRDLDGKSAWRAGPPPAKQRPLAAVFILGPRRTEGPVVQADVLAPSSAMTVLMSHRYSRVAKPQRVRSDFGRASRLAKTVPVTRLTLLDRIDALQDAAGILTAMAAGV